MRTAPANVTAASTETIFSYLLLGFYGREIRPRMVLCGEELCQERSQLTSSRSDSMARSSISCGKCFSGDDVSGWVGSGVEDCLIKGMYGYNKGTTCLGAVDEDTSKGNKDTNKHKKAILLETASVDLIAQNGH